MSWRWAIAVTGAIAAATTLSGCSGTAEEHLDATASALAQLHEDEATFIGVVTGYESVEPGGCRDENCVMVDGASVSLSLIETWEVSCYDGAGLDRDLAVQAKEEALPVGTRVQVVRDLDPSEWLYNFDGFIHRLDDAGAPLPMSANEELVATGYWVPEYTRFNSWEVGNYWVNVDYGTGELAYRGEPIYRLKSTVLTPVQAEYAPKLVDAANAARINRVGGQDTCLRQIEERAASEADGYAHYQDTSRQLELQYEQWKRDHPGWGHCRDGDGDGVCYER